MCEYCVEIDKRIEKYRLASHLTVELSEIERKRLAIEDLYRDRLRLHKIRKGALLS
jgi:hypothetical protein